MADDLDAIAQAAEAAERAQQDATGKDDTDFAAKVRSWFVEAWTSNFWSKYRKYAAEDMGYYTGGDQGEGQWSYDGSTEDYEKLKSAGRAHLTLNNIQPIVDVVTGYERQNRYDLKTMPQGGEDAEDAELMTLLLKHEQDRTDTHAHSSDAFERTLIQGMAATEVGIDWTQDPVQGDIRLEDLEPGVDVIWDPNWKRRDLSDARYVLQFQSAWVEDVVADHPDHEKVIREAVGALDVAIEGGKLSEWSPVDSYGSVQSHAQETDDIRRLFYDQKGGGRVLVIQAWYAEYEDAWIISDKKTGSVTEVESGSIAKEMAAADPDHLTAIRRRKRVIRSGVVLPAIYKTLEEGETPYENDEEAYPIVICLGKRKGDLAYGMVRQLKDSQRAENKRESQLQDLIANIATLRLIYEETALVNPEVLKDPFSKEPIAVRAGHGGPAAVGFLVPPLGEIVSALRATGDRNKMALRESSGINTEVLGMETDQASGIAIARRQAQGQIISTVWFDNYRNYRKLIGQRLVRRIQQAYTMERTVRLVGPDGSEMLVQINPAGAKEMADDQFLRYKEEKQKELGPTDPRPKILRDPSALELDVVISEVPTTPSMRATSLLAILEILKVFPGVAPALIIPAIELAELPDKARTLGNVKKLIPPELGGTAPPPPAAPPPPTGPIKTPRPQGLPPGLPAASPAGASGLPIEGMKR